MALTSHNYQIPLISGWRMEILIYYITVDFVGFATHLVLRRKETRKRKEGRMKKGRKRR